MLIVANASHNLATPALMIHCIPFLTDIGIDPLWAAGIMSIMVAVSIPFRFISGVLADRAGRSRLRLLVAGAYLMQAVGFGAFLLHQTMPMIYVWFILYGTGLGLGSALGYLMRARYFGRKALGSIHGSSQFIMTPIGMAAPIYAGWVYDTTGSYITAFILVAVLLAIAAVLMLLVLPPKPPARITDIRQIV